MADRPSARDDERLPWLESTEAERSRGRKPVSRGVLVGLLAAFFGIGLAVAFSLGYRVARPETQAPAPARAAPPRQTATVQVPLAPPVPTPQVELIVPSPVAAEPPVGERKSAAAAKPAMKKARVVRHKAKPRHVRHVRHARRKPILRPFINVKRPPPKPAVAPRSPYVGPAGKLIQLGAYSTPKQADRAWRSIAWRYPYLAKKPRLVVPTPPVGGYTYYRLRLATQTRAQSMVICQYLQARGQSCIVLY
jgi:hypothetical protein